MRSSTPLDMQGRCARCFLPLHLCLCPELPRVETRTRLVILRHHKESFKSSNTARLATLALPNCTLLGYGGPEATDFDSAVRAPGTWVLFPDGPPAPSRAFGAVRQLVVLDGSWPQARRMNQRIEGLRGLPRLSLPPPPAHSIRLRQPLHPDGMSTLEAIAGAVAALEGDAQAEPLYALHALSVARVLASRGRPGRAPLPRRRER